MNSWQNPFFIVCVLTGLTFIIVSIITTRYPPKEINRIYGYRTKRSMSSQKHWNFAQEYSAELMQKYGLVLVLCGFIGYFLKLSDITGTLLSSALIIFAAIGIIYRTEKAMKDEFDEV